MKTKLLRIVVALIGNTCVSGQLASAQDLRASYTIADGGLTKNYELALDEVSIKDAAGNRTVKKTPDADVAGMLKSLESERSKAQGEVSPVLYQAGKAKTEFTRAHVTTKLLVRLDPTVDAKELARSHGMRVTATPGYAPDCAVLEAASPEIALAGMEVLRGTPGVISADVLLATQKRRKSDPDDTLFNQQWHLRNSTQSGGALMIDLNVVPVWNSNITGSGVVVGVLDDGLQHAHPDLSPNYNAGLSYDFNSRDADPTPVDLAADSHGTACAGLIGARGNNTLGVTGVAYGASLAGFRLIAAANTDQDEADAFAFHNDLIQVKSNSWGEPDDGETLGGPGPLAKAALIDGVTNGRGGKGTIYVFAGGNGLDVQDNSNYDGYANAVEVIAVGAVNDYGFQSYYSEPGANLVVCAPSNGGGHNAGIVTTDLTGDSGYNSATTGAADLADRDYTKTFGGTSAACPQVAGSIALMLQANPNLGWRDVKEILLRTARPVHSTDSDWVTNGGGFHFNHKYGAGLIDVEAAVSMSQNWTNLPSETTTQLTDNTVSSIPDSPGAGVSRGFNFTNSNFRVEHVEVTVNITHPARGNLEILLTSPSGTISRLAEQHADFGADYPSWTFSSVRHWGESATGNWTVTVTDRNKFGTNVDVGTLNSVTVKLRGTSTSSPRIAGTTATLTAEGNLPANSAADPGEFVTFAFGLKNVGSTPTSNLTATLLPLAGVTTPSASQAYGVLDISGTSVVRSFSFRAKGANGTKVKAIFQLQDGATNLGYATCVVPLGKSTVTQVSASGTITINDNGVASPYPSSLSVSGLVGRVQNLIVLVSGFKHTYPDDVGLLLQGPDHLQMQVFSGGATASSFPGVDYTFDGNASIYMPFITANGVAVPAGSYKPFDQYGSSRTMAQDPGDEPAYTLGEFNGVPANGTWKLFAQDFAAGDSGGLGGWRLTFTTVSCTDNIYAASAASNVVENGGSVQVVVRRTGGREGTATVNYATSNGTALAGTHYTAVSGTLNFASGELEKAITVPILDDGIPGANKTFSLTLTSPTGNADLGGQTSTSVTILDTDVPSPVNLSPASFTVTESASLITFTVSRAAVGTAGTVDFSTTPGTATAGMDYTTSQGTLSFGVNDVSKTFVVPLLDDNLYESDETFSVALSNATSGLALGTAISTTVTIHDGDTDGDGLPDDYETMHGLNPSVSTDAMLDSDGDGFTNLQEFLLGTDPQDRASTLRPFVSRSGSDVRIDFTSVVGRTYAVEASSSLQPPWTTIQGSIPGTGGNISVTHTGGAAGPRQFYRVKATMP